MDNKTIVRIIVGAVIIINLIGLLTYIYRKSSYLSRHCDDINAIYTDIGKVASFNVNAPENQDMNLRDYYIKTAYNCCAVGGFKNSYVSTCALKQIIRQGVRCLDMEIYSIDGKPAVAVSSLNSYNFKQSFNSIPLIEVIRGH
jgi:hypothetical protein